jgi:dihydrofolate synthase/folylpolyglutamate synthase
VYQSKDLPAIDQPVENGARQVALDWLLARINYERTAFVAYQDRTLKLDCMRQLLTRLGQPDAGLKIVHVAGTKGKGSTAAFIAAMLTAAGYRTGVFSSPHLTRIEERFAIDGQPCSAEELIGLVERLRPVVESMDAEAAPDGDAQGGPTYFDVTTAMALVYFADRQVDAVVLEVGLGGRLDSTNVCLPAVSVITSISFDHMKQLGNTLAAIAREKAGIIKPGVPVISGVLDAEPRAVIAAVAREHGCRLIELDSDFHYQYELASDNNISAQHSPQAVVDFSYRVLGQEFELHRMTLGMRGPHQAANAAVALAAAAELRHQGWCISTDAMRDGVARAALPGRVEVLAGDPTTVLDAAHNPASARALVAALAEMPKPSRRTLVLSISHDKDFHKIVEELTPHFDRFIVTQYQDNPRAVDAETLAQVVRAAIGNAPGQVCVSPTPRDAWQNVCRTAIPQEQVCITGSFYLAAEMRPLVLSPAAPVGR